jgi:hypothetical protein
MSVVDELIALKQPPKPKENSNEKWARWLETEAGLAFRKRHPDPLPSAATTALEPHPFSSLSDDELAAQPEEWYHTLAFSDFLTSDPRFTIEAARSASAACMHSLASRPASSLSPQERLAAGEDPTWFQTYASRRFLVRHQHLVSDALRSAATNRPP